MKNVCKLFFTIMAIATYSFAVEPPICEEFNLEFGVDCVATEKQAVIITYHEDGSRTYEYFNDGKKAYLELGANHNSIYANSGKRSLAVANIPSDDKEEYIRQVFDAVLTDIDY